MKRLWYILRYEILCALVGRPRDGESRFGQLQRQSGLRRATTHPPTLGSRERHGSLARRDGSAV